MFIVLAVMCACALNNTHIDITQLARSRLASKFAFFYSRHTTRNRTLFIKFDITYQYWLFKRSFSSFESKD